MRASVGSGLGFGCQHSQTLERWLVGTPGLKVAVASGARSAYGLTKAAIRDDDPVVVLEPRALYGRREDFEPSEDAVSDLGIGESRERGLRRDDRRARPDRRHRRSRPRKRAEWSAEVIDLRTIQPWDKELVRGLGGKDRAAWSSSRKTSTPVGGGPRSCPSSPRHCYGDLQRSADSGSLRQTCTCPMARPLEQRFLPVARVRQRASHGASEDGCMPERLVGGRAVSVSIVDARASRYAVVLRCSPAASERYERMVEIRLIEERVLELFGEGLIPGTTHTCQGQEAVCVGIAAATQADRHSRLHLPRPRHGAGARVPPSRRCWARSSAARSAAWAGSAARCT